MARFSALIFGLLFVATAQAGEPSHSFSCSFASGSGERTIEFSIPVTKNESPGKLLGLGQLAIRGTEAPILFVAQSNGIEFEGSRFVSANLVVVGRGTIRIAQSRENGQAWILSDVDEVGINGGRPVQASCITAAQRLR